jgi:hypothetical protein
LSSDGKQITLSRQGGQRIGFEKHRRDSQAVSFIDSVHLKKDDHQHFIAVVSTIQIIEQRKGCGMYGFSISPLTIHCILQQSIHRFFPFM